MCSLNKSLAVFQILVRSTKKRTYELSGKKPMTGNIIPDFKEARVIVFQISEFYNISTKNTRSTIN